MNLLVELEGTDALSCTSLQVCTAELLSVQADYVLRSVVQTVLEQKLSSRERLEWTGCLSLLRDIWPDLLLVDVYRQLCFLGGIWTAGRSDLDAREPALPTPQYTSYYERERLLLAASTREATRAAARRARQLQGCSTQAVFEKLQRLKVRATCQNHCQKQPELQLRFRFSQRWSSMPFVTSKRVFTLRFQVSLVCRWIFDLEPLFAILAATPHLDVFNIVEQAARRCVWIPCRVRQAS